MADSAFRIGVVAFLAGVYVSCLLMLGELRDIREALTASQAVEQGVEE